MKYAFVAAALAGSVFASQHNAHAGFHQRRHYGAVAQEDVCTVYTTVYVTPEHPAPHYPTATPETPKPVTPAVPQQSQPGYPAVPPPNQPAVPTQSQPGYPTQSQPGYPMVPKESQPAVPTPGQPGYPAVPPPGQPGVPESTSCTEETPQPTGPVPQESQPAVPTPGKPGYPAVPPPNQPAVSTESQPGYPAVPPHTQPAVPTESQPGYPAVPPPNQPPQPGVPESTSCTEETPKPTGPVPTSGQPGYPAVPPPNQPAVPTESQPAYPAVPPHSQPAVPTESQPGYPVSQPPQPGVPESTTCTEETTQPTAPASTPEVSKPVTPAVPEQSQPGYPTGPQPPKETKPTQPETPKESPPTQPETPKSTQPGYPTAPKPSPPASSSSTPAGGKPTPPSNGSEKPKQSAPAGGNGQIVNNGHKWAITYTPYAQSGDCKTADEVASDIKKISELGFTTIRSYNTDCGVFEHVVPECEKYGLKVIYGIFLEAGGKEGKGCFSDYANKQLEEIKTKAPKDSVAMVIVGNESMFNGYCKPDELASYIDHVRNELYGAGFPSTTAVTTTEPVNIWEEMGAALCDHLDVFVCQVQPYFTQSITADMAGDFAAQQLDQAAKVCPGAAAKGKYIGEIGWPSSGQPNGKAVASPENQKIAMKSIQDKVGAHACVFSFQDDLWKPAGDLGVEQHFGCIDALSS